MAVFKNFIEKDKVQLDDIERLIDDIEQDLQDHIDEIEDKIHTPTTSYDSGSLTISFGFPPNNE